MRTLTVVVGNNRIKISCHKRDIISITLSGKTRLKPKQNALNYVTFSQEKAKGL